MQISSFRTDEGTRAQATTAWADLVCQTFVQLDCDFGQAEHFQGEIQRCVSGGFDFAHVASTTLRVARTRARIARSSDDDLLLSLQTSGRCRISQNGHEALLEAGDFTIYDTARPYEIKFDKEYSKLVLRLPRRMVERRIADLDSLTARTVCGSRGMGKLASTFLRQIHAQIAEIDPVSLPRVHANAIDLIAAALAEQNCAPTALNESQILLRRRTISYIDKNIADPRLSCETIAAAQGVSARHLRKVFENATLSVSELIWARRLEQARRDLADPLNAHVSVTGVGYDVGFKDPAHFSRAFKTAFGMTPSAFRSASLDDLNKPAPRRTRRQGAEAGW